MLRRLGTSTDQKRPLHVTLNTPQQRDTIIATSKELKDAGAAYSRVFINKDIHPVVRKEIGRLRKVAKDEKNKSGNANADITYDAKNRVVKRDDVIIDRFTPKFF